MNPDLILADPPTCLLCGEEDHGDHDCDLSDDLPIPSYPKDPKPVPR